MRRHRPSDDSTLSPTPFRCARCSSVPPCASTHTLSQRLHLKTEHLTVRTTVHHRRIFFSCRANLFIQCTCIGSRASRLKKSYICQPASCSKVIPWACLPVLFTFRLYWRRNLGANCVDPQARFMVFGRMAAQSPLTGDEPNSLIEISKEYTPMNFPSRRNSFNTNLSSVPTTAAASDVADFHEELSLTLVTQETEVSAKPFSTSVKQLQAAASSSQHPRVSKARGKC